ncbi:hypothetical protein ONZ45_g12985 [Pleurotus djamor]|nr:hypothetical protein ONZ45_g12985 [Pleurotus djamor]
MPISTDFDAQRSIDEEIKKYHPINDKSTIRSLCTRRNTHAAISKLPTEILSTIFIACTSPHTPHTPYDRECFVPTREAVMGVCSRWKEVVESTPRMWSFISPLQGGIILDIDFNCLLKLQIASTGTSGRESASASSSMPNLLEFQRLVIAETHRFEEFYIHFPRSAPQPQPSISRLHLPSPSTFISHFFPPHPHTPLHAPRLRTLEIQKPDPFINDRGETCQPLMVLHSFWVELHSLRRMKLINVLPTASSFAITPQPHPATLTNAHPHRYHRGDEPSIDYVGRPVPPACTDAGGYRYQQDLLDVSQHHHHHPNPNIAPSKSKSNHTNSHPSSPPP